MHPPIRAILLDMDGVLLDSFEAWLATVREVAAALGVSPPSREAYRARFGQAVEADVDDLYAGRTTAFDLVRLYQEHLRPHLDKVDAAPGVHGLLDSLRAEGRPLACVTNTPGPLARSMLRAKGLAPLLDAIVGAGEVPRGKPAPDLVLAALRRLGGGIDANEAALIGDSEVDIAAGRAAGVRTIGLGVGGGDARIERLDALPAALGDGAGGAGARPAARRPASSPSA